MIQKQPKEKISSWDSIVKLLQASVLKGHVERKIVVTRKRLQ